MKPDLRILSLIVMLLICNSAIELTGQENSGIQKIVDKLPHPKEDNSLKCYPLLNLSKSLYSTIDYNPTEKSCDSTLCPYHDKNKSERSDIFIDGLVTDYISWAKLYTRWRYALLIILIIVLLMVIRQYELKRIIALMEANRLKELNRLRTKYYTNLTHQFRTPLTVILGMSREFNKKPVEAANLIERNSRQILRLINQLLDLSKLESGMMQLELINGDVIPFLKYLAESFQSFAETKNIQLVFYTEVDKLILDYDEEKLQHVVSNILSNAIKYTSENGKIIFHINNQVTDTNQELIMKIKDSGIGIHPLALPNIFNRYYRDVETDNHGVEGTGIGLALTKELVNLMGGNITAKSELGRGSEFIIVLPIRSTAIIGHSNIAHETFRIDKVNSYNKNIYVQNKNDLPGDTELPLVLIIEDNQDVRTYIEICLAGQYRFESAINGRLGIEKAIQLIPDVIISDVLMPLKNGYEVCHVLKNDKRTSHIPIILLTAKAGVEDKLTGLQKGADVYLIKPFDKEELSIRLKKLIELRTILQNRFGNITSQSSSSENCDSFDEESLFLNKMKQIVENHLDDADFTIPQFCRDAGMSRTQLHRKLKALTGKSATHFVRSIRLHTAYKLLRTTKFNVSEIAYMTGFRDPAYFSTSYYKEFGFNPSGTSKSQITNDL